VIISDIHKKAQESTRKEFETLIQPFRVKNHNTDTLKGIFSRPQINWVTSAKLLHTVYV
jgi:hypothetical protein